MSTKVVDGTLFPSGLKLILFFTLLLTYKQCLFDFCMCVTLEQRPFKFILCVDDLTACISGYHVSV